MGQTQTRYHVAIDVDDRAGVLAAVATTFAEHGVSIQTVRQEGHGDDAQLVVVSHRASDEALSSTVEALRGRDFVHDVSSVMRVEGEG
jgi:homoserine dehydrogenase